MILFFHSRASATSGDCEVVQKIFLVANVAGPFRLGLWMQETGQGVFWADWGAEAFLP